MVTLPFVSRSILAAADGGIRPLFCHWRIAIGPEYPSWLARSDFDLNSAMALSRAFMGTNINFMFIDVQHFKQFVYLWLFAGGI